jgi:DNA-directed RNA polymerase specialized sigma24 family protein
MAVENVGEAIAAKDPRTQQAYIETLARLKVALVDLEEMVDILHAALHDRERRIRDGSRSKLLLRLWNSGKSAEEVSTIMGIKPDSVYSWLTKLRAKGKDVRSPMQETDKDARRADT